MDEFLNEYEKTRWVSHSDKICHAPYISLNFDQDGNIRACCYNVTHPLGKYPVTTIAEALKSASAQSLRQAIENKDFSQGCYNCKQQLLARNFFSVHARNFDLPILKFPLETVPRVLEFELSNICNLECAMCNGFFSSLIRRNREKLPPIKNPYSEDFLNQIRGFWKDAYVARFLGGEPFLNSLYFKMWDQIKAENSDLNVSITTNGTILTDRVRDVIKTLRPNISISLDSIEKKTYESIRVNANFETVMKNVNEMILLLEQVNRKLHLSVCPMTSNWHEMPDLFVWGTNRGISVNLNTVLNPSHLSLRFLSSDKLAEVIQFLQKKKGFVEKAKITFGRKDDYTVRSNLDRYQSLINQLDSWKNSSPEQAL